jgi:coenzyme F420-reducing hydrogenase alpha subunit
MSIEGKLRIELLCRDNRIQRVSIFSSRPLQLPLLFEGKAVEKVLQTLPMLYSICATAQANAAAIACRQAVGVSVDPNIQLAETLLVWFETAREHLWRILIDWPDYLSETGDTEQLPGLSQLIPEAKRALFDNMAPAFSLQPLLRPKAETLTGLIDRLARMLECSVFNMPAPDWHAMTSLEALERWMEAKETGAARYLQRVKDAGVAQLGQSGIGALPPIDAELMHARMQADDSDGFIAAPEWQSGPRETSCLTRQAEHPLIKAMEPVYGKGVLTRLVSRLVELASIQDRMKALLLAITRETEPTAAATPALPKGIGLGVVEAARGRLVHRASVRGNTIDRYQILAPTEWNFHPRGLVAEGLLRLACGDESTMQEHASLFISAVDPCVGYSFEFV